jgi:hypothetical protein
MDLIPVKKSTLATWCREVKLTEEQYEAIRQRTGSREGIPRDTNRKRREEIERIRTHARTQVPGLINDPLWVAGTVLYWAEGAKTRNHLMLNNTDPRALRLFIKWIRAFIDRNADFSMQLHLHEGNNEADAMAFWRSETGLAESNLRPSSSPKGRATGRTPLHMAFAPSGCADPRMPGMQ